MEYNIEDIYIVKNDLSLVIRIARKTTWACPVDVRAPNKEK